MVGHKTGEFGYARRARTTILPTARRVTDVRIPEILWPVARPCNRLRKVELFARVIGCVRSARIIISHIGLCVTNVMLRSRRQVKDSLQTLLQQRQPWRKLREVHFSHLQGCEMVIGSALRATTITLRHAMLATSAGLRSLKERAPALVSDVWI